MSFLLALIVSLSSPASAQQPVGFDAHGFQLAAHDSDLRDPLVAKRPGAFTAGDLFVGTLAEYASAPLVMVSEASLSGDVVEEAVLDHVGALNLSLGAALHDRVRIDAKMPVYVVSVDQRASGIQPPSPGDVRLSTMVVGVRPKHLIGGGGLGLGLTAHLDVPTGRTDRFLGQSGVAGGAGLAATYEFSRATLTADLGTQFNPSLDLSNLNGSDTLHAAFGVGALASDRVGLTAEFVAQPPFQPPERLTFPAELMGSARFLNLNSNSFWTLGGAMGLTSGPGVAAFRVFVGGGIARQEPPRAPDADVIGQFAIRDLCPTEFETQNGWKDDDGCPDTLSALAMDVRWQGEPVEADIVLRGPDGDEQLTIGPEGLQRDAVPGSQWSVTATRGPCLEGEARTVANAQGSAMRVDLFQRLDAHVVVEVLGPDEAPLPQAVVSWEGEPSCLPDGESFQVNVDGLLDHDIGPGGHTLVVTAPGHAAYSEPVMFAEGDARHLRVQLARTLIRIEKLQIVILEKVHFETARAVIKPSSFPLLDEVSATIITNPQLGRVEVAGHTDSRGSDSYNLELSDARAQAVRSYLIGQGVTEDRLVAVGYGETVPLDTNRTSIGREANRRVEFNLMDSVEDSGDDAGSEAPDPQEAE